MKNIKKVIKCSNCEKPLFSIITVKPEVDVNFKIRAKCPICKDFSFMHEAKGLFSIGDASDEPRIGEIVVTNYVSSNNIIEVKTDVKKS